MSMEAFPELYQIYRGEVASVQSYGAFIKLEGFRKHGLVHKSQISRTDRVEDVSEVLSTGDRVWAKVISLGEDEEKKISLSMKVVNQDSGRDLDPNMVLTKQEEQRRNKGGYLPKPKIELGAVLNTTCKKCGTKGHLTQDCFYQPGDKAYDLIPDLDEAMMMQTTQPTTPGKHKAHGHKKKKKKKKMAPSSDDSDSDAHRVKKRRKKHKKRDTTTSDETEDSEREKSRRKRKKKEERRGPKVRGQGSLDSDGEDERRERRKKRKKRFRDSSDSEDSDSSADRGRKRSVKKKKRRRSASTESADDSDDHYRGNHSDDHYRGNRHKKGGEGKSSNRVSRRTEDTRNEAGERRGKEQDRLKDRVESSREREKRHGAEERRERRREHSGDRRERRDDRYHKMDRR